jgi:uncharacterized caspase-like protein
VRVALVIGNSAHQNVPFLPNPINDASDISESLKRLGFDVKTLTNARYDDMRRALIDFVPRAQGADIAVIFFCRPWHPEGFLTRPRRRRRRT